MARAAVFLDGGYFRMLGRRYFPDIAVDYARLTARIRARMAGDVEEPLGLLRTYYYDCPPFQSDPPTDEERRRYGDYRRFADSLDCLRNFEVRLGRLQLRGRRGDGSPIFRRKRVDLLLGLDLALLCGKNRVTHVALVAGDGDFTPAVRVAKREGATVWLFHGPRGGADGGSTSGMLYREADARVEMDAAFMSFVRRLPA